MTSLPFALQLYTVRDYLERDVPETLRRVKAAGYDAVEVAGTYGHSAAAFRRILADSGLTPISAHLGYEESVIDPESALAFAQALEVPYLVVPWLGKEVCPTREAWSLAAQAMSAAGARLAQGGVQLCYHNHAEEFERLEGIRPFDLIFQVVPAAHLVAEIDTYWVTYAGEDPVALIKRFAGRCPLLHIKDMAASSDRGFAEVGQGIMDWGRIFAAGRASGAEWFIVEQDECAGDALESAALSARFMRTCGF